MISVEHLGVLQGAFALRDVTFTVPTACYAVLMGRTGSGKTTLLEAISGLRPSRTGRVLLSGRDVTLEKPAGRGIGYVPQDGALFGTMTVRDNLGFSLNVRKWTRERIDKRVDELSDMLGITPLLGRLAQKLSGGEAQRVAVGRALAFYPSVLLLDEPLSALDEETRTEMVELLKSVRAHAKVTVLHVTHRVSDAERLADIVFVLRDGAVRIQN